MLLNFTCIFLGLIYTHTHTLGMMTKFSNTSKLKINHMTAQS